MIGTSFQLDHTGRAHLVVTDQTGWAESGPATLWVAADFGGAAAMLTALAARLAQERMGLRLYAVGSEGFLWDVARIGEAAGLGRAEMVLTKMGEGGRRVYCTHCRAVAEDVRGDFMDCGLCGTRLAVRAHFSRRLGAYMGVLAHEG